MLRWDTQHKTDTSKHCCGTLFNNPLDHWNPQNYFSTRAAKKYLQIHYQAITSSYIGTYMYIYMPQKQHNWPLWDKSTNVIYKKEISVHFQFQGCQYRYRAQSASQLLESDTFVLWFWELWPKHKCFDFIDQIVWSSSSKCGVQNNYLGQIFQQGRHLKPL